jgi:hypothetical protein
MVLNELIAAAYSGPSSLFSSETQDLSGQCKEVGYDKPFSEWAIRPN